MTAPLPILLPTSAATADDHAPLDWLGRYCIKLVESGPYQWSDLPPAARWFCALDTYAGEVSNGGHIQYFQNTRLARNEIEACRAGLTCLPDNPFGDIFEKSVDVIWADASLRDRFLERDVAGWSTDELARVEARLEEQDKRFFRDAGGSDAFFALAGPALLGRPEVRLVEQQGKEIKALLVRHPEFDQSTLENSGGSRAFPPRPMTEQQRLILTLAGQVCQALRRRMTGFPVCRDGRVSVRGQWHDTLELKTDQGLLLLAQIAGKLVIYDASDMRDFKALGTLTMKDRLDFEQMRGSALHNRQV